MYKVTTFLLFMFAKTSFHMRWQNKMNRILTKCWHSITLMLLNCWTTTHVKLYIWKAKQDQLYAVQCNTTYYTYNNINAAILFICAPQLCIEQNNYDLGKKRCLTNSLCFCLCWNLANAFLVSHSKDIAVVKYTLLSSQ